MSHVSGRKFLLIGGAGFIGSHLVDHLLALHAEHVVIVDNFFLGSRDNLTAALKSYPDRVTVIEGDACDYQMLSDVVSDTEPEIVINLATKALLHSFQDPADAYKVNVDIILNLLELIRKNSYSKLIHISTSEVFGSGEYMPMDENHPRKPETTYAAGKCAADMAVESYIRMFGVNAIILRPFNNFGPRQNFGDLSAIIPKTIRNILCGDEIYIEGDGLQTRDFIYVKDTVRIISDFLKVDKLHDIDCNIGSGQELSIKKLMDSICRLMHYDGIIQKRPARKADVKRHQADVTKMKKYVENLSLTPFEEALEETIDDYQNKVSAPYKALNINEKK